MMSAPHSIFNTAAEQRVAPRHKVRFTSRVQSYARFSFNSLDSGDLITDVTVNDLSLDGASASHSNDLAIGAIVRLQVPLVGWRNAEIRWLGDGHAGCRFLVPLTQEELHSAIVSSADFSANFPGLVDHIGGKARPRATLRPDPTARDDDDDDDDAIALPHPVPRKQTPTAWGLAIGGLLALALWLLMFRP